MWFIIAVLSAIVFGTAGFLMKVNQVHKGTVHFLLLGLYASGSAGFFLNLLLEESWHQIDFLNVKLWIGGFVIGMGSAWGNHFFMKALDYGPASLTAPLINLNIIFIILLSVFAYHEHLTLLEFFGIFLLIIAVMFISFRRGESYSITEKKWFFYVFISIILFGFRNGGLKVTASLSLDNAQILFYGYFLAFLFFIGSILLQRGQSISIKPRINRADLIGLLWGLLAGLFSYGGLKLYSIALQMGKAGIVAPIFSTYTLIIALGAIILFKEKLTLLQKLAFTLLLIGLLIVRLS